MEVFELDNVMQKLQEVCEVLSSSKMTEAAARGWREFFINRDYEGAVSALDSHLANGERKPRPQDIKALMSKRGCSMGATEGAVYKGNCPITESALRVSETAVKADARTNSAWIIYHNLSFSGKPPVPNVEQNIDMTVEEALIFVNKHAARINMPEAIEDKYKLTEYWENSVGY